MGNGAVTIYDCGKISKELADEIEKGDNRSADLFRPVGKFHPVRGGAYAVAIDNARFEKDAAYEFELLRFAEKMSSAIARFSTVTGRVKEVSETLGRVAVESRRDTVEFEIPLLPDQIDALLDSQSALFHSFDVTEKKEQIGEVNYSVGRVSIDLGRYFDEDLYRREIDEFNQRARQVIVGSPTKNLLLKNLASFLAFPNVDLVLAVSEERFGAISSLEQSARFVSRLPGALSDPSLGEGSFVPVRFLVDLGMFQRDPVYRSRLVTFSRAALAHYDALLADGNRTREELPVDLRPFLDILEALVARGEAIDGAKDPRQILKEEFGVSVVEKDRRFEDWMLLEAATLLRSLPKGYASKVKNLIRTEKCASGKCALAANNLGGDIAFYDSFYTPPAGVDSHTDELYAMSEISRFNMSLAHEIAHHMVHDATHVDFERLTAYYDAREKKPHVHGAGEAERDAEIQELENTLMYRWASINGWTIPNLEKTEYQRTSLLTHIQGPDHGYKLHMRGLVRPDGTPDMSDPAAIFLRDNRWLIDESEWRVARSSFVTAGASDLKRGTVESLVDSIAYFISKPNEFALEARSYPVIQAQFDFIRQNFFPE